MSITTKEPNEELKRKLKAMVDEHGLWAVSQRLDIGREQLSRYAAGFPLQSSTLKAIEHALSEGAPSHAEGHGS